MSDLSKKESASSGISWKLAAVGSVVSVIAALITLGDVPLIISGLMLLAAVGWGFTARDNKRALERE